ncbi:hypothetical protein ACFORO_42445 [Amycolatopsis halotolerans]|uniref:Uncharacterized protein n=1 Tax=Amycolatopsis halotolerans TaxID=330083 RepID=A0ABV7QY86_9PSEU
MTWKAIDHTAVDRPEVSREAYGYPTVDNLNDLNTRAIVLEGRTLDGTTGNAALGSRVSAVESGKVPTTRTVATSAGLQGGGDLSANRTISPVYGTAANTIAQGNDARIAVTQDGTIGNSALGSRVSTLESRGVAPKLYTGAWAGATSTTDVTLGVGAFNAYSSYVTCYTVTIPDPGYAYTLTMNAGFPIQFGGTTARYGYISFVVGAATNTPSFIFDVGYMPESWTAFQIPQVTDTTSRTGATTVYMRGISNTPGTLAKSTRNWCQVTVNRA